MNLTLPDGNVLEANRSKEIGNDAEWVEMFVGARLRCEFAERWSVGIRGDVGGFDIGPDQFAWQVIGGIGYSFPLGNATGAVLIGYRALSQDYEDGDFAWDMTAYGPLIGFQISF